ncbi:BMC domain-containing protein [Brenneria izadpanahii]|uniref:BMC domain-containing protein n=1 Tax=Brenneria izadpanahii TaxID=2722756 RepID=A0ABX7US82_9GAMM|nr:BMC domain-containing protein [Brenneria izadpanahii]QTF08594.1 BMC domain-containing protein [Brenneria izadpanahii]
MQRRAMGFVETIGFASAIVAADVALKSADVALVRMESVIGVGKSIGVTVYFTGDVAAVQAAVARAKTEVAALNTLVSAHVIAGVDAETQAKLIRI